MENTVPLWRSCEVNTECKYRGGTAEQDSVPSVLPIYLFPCSGRQEVTTLFTIVWLEQGTICTTFSFTSGFSTSLKQPGIAPCTTQSCWTGTIVLNPSLLLKLLHNQLCHCRVTPQNDLVYFTISIYMEVCVWCSCRVPSLAAIHPSQLEKGIQPACFTKDLCVTIHGRDSRPTAPRSIFSIFTGRPQPQE